MKTDWLTAASFERTHELLSAINLLSIYIKLTIAGVTSPIGKTEVQKAKECLLTFLDSFETPLRDTEQRRDGTIVSSDPRMGELVTRYLAQKRHLSQGDSVYELSLDNLRELVMANTPSEMASLVPYLKDLRSLIEQHAYTDVVELLGDI